jgi:hypothetical protein
MILHAAVSILVAVALPLWLVVEQLMKWRVLSKETTARTARSSAEAGRAQGALERTSPVGRTNNSTGPALRRRAA